MGDGVDLTRRDDRKIDRCIFQLRNRFQTSTTYMKFHLMSLTLCTEYVSTWYRYRLYDVDPDPGDLRLKSRGWNLCGRETWSKRSRSFIYLTESSVKSLNRMSLNPKTPPLSP